MGILAYSLLWGNAGCISSAAVQPLTLSVLRRLDQAFNMVQSFTQEGTSGLGFCAGLRFFGDSPGWNKVWSNLGA